MDTVQSTADSIVAEFPTYEAYLDSQITPKDLYYLEDESLARQLVELSYRGGELKREEFEQRKKNAESSKSKKAAATSIPKVLASSGKDFTNSPFLQALAEREELTRSGKLAVGSRSDYLNASSVSSSSGTRTRKDRKSVGISIMPIV